MKVLFAIGNEQTSKKVAEKYYNKYGEELEYKNVFYFKALLEEVKKDKTYDRIVISEDLEQFYVKSIEAFDRIIFNYIDGITDEIEDSEIIFICSDRRTKQNDSFVERLFNIGVYNMLIGDERTIEPLCKYIKKPLNKKEAKRHLNITSIVSEGSPLASDDTVEEDQIMSILKYYDNMKINGKTSQAEYVKAFDDIAEQYNKNQLKVILLCLPADVRNAVYDSNRYTFLMDEEELSRREAKEKAQKKISNKPAKRGGLFGILRDNRNKETQKPMPEVTVDNNQKEMERQQKEQEELKKKAEQEALARQQAELKAKQEAMAKQEAELKAKAEREALARAELQKNTQVTTAPENRNLVENTTKPSENDIEIDVMNSVSDKNSANEQDELRKRVEQEALAKQQEELKKKAEQEALANEQEELKRKAEQEALAKQQAELKRKAEQEALARQQEELKKKAEQEALANEQEELKRKAEQEALARQQEELKRKAEQEALARKQEELKRKAEQEALARQQEELKKKAEKEALAKEQEKNVNVPPVMSNTNNMKIEQDRFEAERRKLEQEKQALEEEKRRLREQTERLNQNTGMTTTTQNEANYDEPRRIDFKKMVLFVGSNKSGTTFTVNAVAHALAAQKITVGMLDMTRDKSMYYIYNQDDRDLRNIASECMQKLSEGIDSYIPVKKNLKVYTSVSSSDSRKAYRNRTVIDTVREANNLVIVDADFSTPFEYFEKANEIYIVQDLDIIKIQETTLFLRELKNKSIDMNKIRIVINKYVKTMLTPKKLIEGLSYYNDPQMSFIDELLSNKVPYFIIPFAVENYVKYIEGMLKNELDYKKYTPEFTEAINALANSVFRTGSEPKKRRGIFG